MGVVVTWKQVMRSGAQMDPRVLSSHARHGSCAGRRVDGAKLASGAIAASTRCGRGAVSRVFVSSRDGGLARAPEDWL